MKLFYSNTPYRVHGQEIHPFDLEDGEQFDLLYYGIPKNNLAEYIRKGDDIYGWVHNQWIINTRNWFTRWSYKDYQVVYINLNIRL
jgi:hypothetical protein